MSDSDTFPQLQPDGSYRVPNPDPELAKVVWGTVHHWAQKHNLLPQRSRLKTLLSAEFSWNLSVEEGGCEYRLFPQKAAEAVVPQLQREVEQIRLTKN